MGDILDAKLMRGLILGFFIGATVAGFLTYLVLSTYYTAIPGKFLIDNVSTEKECGIKCLTECLDMGAKMDTFEFDVTTNECQCSCKYS